MDFEAGDRVFVFWFLFCFHFGFLWRPYNSHEISKVIRSGLSQNSGLWLGQETFTPTELRFLLLGQHQEGVKVRHKSC